MIRKFSLTDAIQLQEINNKSLGYSFSLEDCQKRLKSVLENADHILIGYTDDLSNLLVGYCHIQLYQTTYAPTVYNILGLAVLPDYQGQGIGRQLISAVEEIAKNNKVNYIRLNSGESRTEAHAFYEHLGYKSDKLQKRFLKELR
ncbi:GNAT family N-acetyltransferase [Streptococcus hongkongensis]|nr:GNAT family acetyltransferase [Streptococcus uberis]